MGFKDLSNKVTYTDNGGSFDNQAVDTVEVENSLSVLANAALSSATAANTSKEAAEAAKTAAETAETNAETAETNAETAETNAETAETNAAASATASANSATAGANSATAAATSETNAASSATTATTKANTATTQATNSANSATASAASATNSANSATAAQTARTNAETAETNAETAETNAETAETNAAASAVTAATQATNSSNSATASATSATAAQTAQTAAETAETNAETAETNAETAETNANASAVTAATHASTATTKASEAATSATNAASSATNAANSATGASNSQIAAASSAASAAAIFDQFDDTYLGSKSSAPTVDNDGNALATGALYYNSSTQGMFIWTGSEWVAASAAGGASLNNFSYTATAGQTTFSGSDENSNTMSYTVDNIIVTLNGVVLEGGGTDYTATNGSSVVLTSGAVVSDEVNIVAFKTFTTADMVSASNGGAYQGNVDFAAGIDVTGNITVTGTVDGRDLAADGTKLDALEANANVTDTANVTAAGALMDSEVTNLAQVKAFDSSDYATAAQGTLATNALPKAGGTMTGNLSLGDSNKAIFGAGSDLQIFHDGSNSIIKDAGAGNLQINAGSFVVNNAANSANIIVGNDGGAVQLYDNGNAKLSTTSTGIDVTGTVTSDGLTAVNTTDTQGKFSGWSVIGANSSSGAIELGQASAYQGIMSYAADDQTRFLFDNTYGSTGSTFEWRTNTAATAKTHMKITGGGDISFYEATGTTPKFFWDASAESLGIGTSSPNISNVGNAVTINSTSSAILELAKNGSRVANFYSDGTTASLTNNTNNPLTFLTNNAEAMRIDSSGNVGIGTILPLAKLDVASSASATQARVRNQSTGAAAILFQNSDTGTSNGDGLYIGRSAAVNYIWTYENEPLVLATNNTERMRIDSSGNVLVGGHTNTHSPVSNGGSGVTLMPNGQILAGGQYPSYFNLEDNDGDIAVFRKDGSTVGSIGAQTRTGNTELGIGTGDTGLNFFEQGNAICPVNMDNGFDRNGAIDLGRDGAAFKDLWLSNAVRLGDASLQEINGTDPFLSSNAYYNGSTWNYLISDSATNYYQAGGDHIWRYAASGTAGNAISWSERMRIDSSGNVGIGEDTPAQKLHLRTSGVNTGVRLQVAGGSGRAYDILSTTDGSLTITDANAGSERMRIDSSGNLLVGKTSSNLANNGTQLSTNGSFFTRSVNSGDGAGVAYFQRNTSDGNIIMLYNSSTTNIGSIGTNGGQLYAGSSDVGMRFRYGSTDAIEPFSPSSGALRDNAIDLGVSNNRFKNVHAVTYHGDGSNLTGVGGSTAGNAVGTYVWGVQRNNYDGALAKFSTESASNVMPTFLNRLGSNGASIYSNPGLSGNNSGYSLSGTWRAMGEGRNNSSNHMGLWLRIS